MEAPALSEDDDDGSSDAADFLQCRARVEVGVDSAAELPPCRALVEVAEIADSSSDDDISAAAMAVVAPPPAKLDLPCRADREPLHHWALCAKMRECKERKRRRILEQSAHSEAVRLADAVNQSLMLRRHVKIKVAVAGGCTQLVVRETGWQCSLAPSTFLDMASGPNLSRDCSDFDMASNRDPT